MNKTSKPDKAPKSRTPTGILFKQKQIMKNAYRDFLAITALICILTLIPVVFSLFPDKETQNAGVVFGMAAFICLIGIFGFWFMQCYLIFRGIDRIQLPGEETVTIRCKKISCITRIISRRSQNIVCIVLTDQAGNKYYDITDRYSNRTVVAATEKIRTDFLSAKLSLRCYTGTRYVKFTPEIMKESL